MGNRIKAWCIVYMYGHSCQALTRSYMKGNYMYICTMIHALCQKNIFLGQR